MAQEHEEQEEHESLIKTPKQLIIAVVLAFVVPIAIAVLFSQLFTSGRRAQVPEETTAALIAPVARVELGAPAPTGPKGSMTGEQVYQAACSVCHAAGVAGAPKTGDKDAWAPRLGKGLEAVAKVAIAGKGAMPPRGGVADLTDVEVARAIVFIANQSGANFKEPAGTHLEKTGEQIVQAQCVKCHGTGEGGAPKIGDKSAWGPRVSRGIDAVTMDAIHGHGGMPARGGLAELSDAEFKRAIVYMFSQVGSKESAAPAMPGSGVAAAPAAAAPAGATAPQQVAAADGKGIYDKACFACHASGAAGAPMTGDKTAWAPRIKSGLDALVASALKGKGAMPPKGGNMALSDADIKAAVDYMLAQSK